MNYDLTDKVIEYIDGQIIELFSKLKSQLSIDELNVLENVNAVYAEVDRISRQAYLKLAQQEYKKLNFTRWIDEQWLEDILTNYDAVSKYIYETELDRKRARLFEAIMSGTDTCSEVDRAMRLLSLQCRVYAVRVTDEAVLQAYKDLGITQVKWVAEMDGKTCSVCIHRDGKIYPIYNIPKKPHINCRCRLERVKR